MMMGVFKTFYDQRTQSRVLRWVHSLATATLSSRFPKGEKELSMNAYQVCLRVSSDARLTLVAHLNM